MTVKPSPLVLKLNQRMSQPPTSPLSSSHTSRTTPSAPSDAHHDGGPKTTDNPQQDLRSQQREFRALDRHFAAKFVQLVLAQRKRAHATTSGQGDPMRPRMQIYDSPHSSTVTVLFELPGLQKSEINVSVGRDGRLTVSGERRPPPLFDDLENGRSRYPVSEIKYGKFERSVDIPPGIEVKDIVTGLTEGMLSISWPREAPRKPNSPPITSVQALLH